MIPHGHLGVRLGASTGIRGNASTAGRVLLDLSENKAFQHTREAAAEQQAHTANALLQYTLFMRCVSTFGESNELTLF